MDEITRKKVHYFFTQFKRYSDKKGTIIVGAEESPKGIYYLLEGNVKQYSLSKKGTEIVVNIYKPPAFFPMSWAMNQTRNDYFL